MGIERGAGVGGCREGRLKVAGASFGDGEVGIDAWFWRVGERHGAGA